MRVVTTAQDVQLATRFARRACSFEYDVRMSEDSRDATSVDTIRADVVVDRAEASVPADYDAVALIGRGGMGEVIAVHDRRIGRDVAIKRMRESLPDEETIARFLREAKIQARLDHPAIVPVYEVGIDSAGLPFFTMKRVAGTTLRERIDAAGAIQPLLRAFAEVCRAIELAHARGVVHRDLKPQNIMLGEYGEVYVLDWGLARTLGDAEAPSGASTRDSKALLTVTGSMLGTPGYMSPEQIEDSSSVGRATDVYALGAILFEILAGAPVHRRGFDVAIASTLGGTDGSPARRAPDRGIALELDALCVAALEQNPANRPEAGELARSVERYLDGDRDFARRRAMAADQLEIARARLANGNRSEAMRAAARALALDPGTRDAAELVTALMLEPPPEPPAELQFAIDRAEGKVVSRHALIGAVSYVAYVALLPIAIVSGVTSWPLLLTTVAITLACAGFALSLTRRPSASVRAMLLYLVGNALVSTLLERVFGPFVFVPVVICVSTMSLVAYPSLALRMRLLVACQLAAWVIPVALEYFGVLASTWEIRDHALVIHSRMLEIGGTSSAALLLITSVGLIVSGGVLAGAVAKARITAQRKLMIRDWHMRQLLPATTTIGPTGVRNPQK
jgi:tRNA A-37 threonylcarbamoyl transferase component Bud32